MLLPLKLKSNKQIRNPRTITLYFRNVHFEFLQSLTQYFALCGGLGAGDPGCDRWDGTDSDPVLSVLQNIPESARDLYRPADPAESDWDPALHPELQKETGLPQTSHEPETEAAEVYHSWTTESKRCIIYTECFWILDLCVNVICRCFSPELNRM